MSRRKSRSKLEKLIDDETNYTFEPTQEDCYFWFDILNAELFAGQLSYPDRFDIRWRRKAFAYHVGWFDTKKSDYIFTEILMNKRYKSKKFFVEVLAHEMVHHHQYLTEKKSDHGQTFMKWKKQFNRKGMNLVRSY